MPYQLANRMATVFRNVNFDHRNTFGLQAMAQFSAGRWLSGNGFFTVVHTNDKDSDFFDIPFNRNKTTVIAGMNATITPSRRAGVSITLRPLFQSKAIQGVYDIKSFFKLPVSVLWLSGDKHWTIRLDGKNLTNLFMQSSDTQANQDYTMRTCHNWREVSLTCVYKFGNYKQRRHKEVDTSRMGY